MSRRVTRALPIPWFVPLPAAVARVEGATTIAGGGAWPAANRAIYYPFFMPATVMLKSVSFYATSSAGNFDIGIYDATGAVKIVSSGSTAMGSNINTWTLTTPVLLEAGVRYYIGMACSSTSAQLVRWPPNVESLRMGGCGQEASAFPLPSPFTMANPANGYLPGFAFDFVQ